MFDSWYMERLHSDIPSNNRSENHYDELVVEDPPRAAFEIGLMYTTRLYSVRDIDIALYWFSKAYELGYESIIVYKYLIYLHIVSGTPDTLAKIEPIYKKLPDTNALYKKALDALFESTSTDDGREKMSIIEKHFSKNEHYPELSDKNGQNNGNYENSDLTSEDVLNREHIEDDKIKLNYNKILVETFLRTMEAKHIDGAPSHDAFYDNQHKSPLLNLFIEAYRSGFEDETTVAKIYDYADKENATAIKFFLDYTLGIHGHEEAYDWAIERSKTMGLEDLSKSYLALKTGKRKNRTRDLINETPEIREGDLESKVAKILHAMDAKRKEINTNYELMRKELESYKLFDGDAYIEVIKEGEFPTSISSNSYLYSTMKYPFYSEQLENMFRAAGMGVTNVFDSDFALSLAIMILINNPDFNFYRNLTRNDIRLLAIQAIQFSQFSLHPKVMDAS